MKIGSHTKVYAVLGHPIGHSFSPVMHNAAYAALDMDALYVALDVAPQPLMSVLTAMREMGLGGVNLTVPLKEIAFRGLPRLNTSAKRLGAVNTVEFTHEGLVGHNTDGYGFLRAHEEAFGCGLHGEKVFVLGAGGAGRAVALMCAEAGAREITLGDMDVIRCHKVAGEVREQCATCAVHVAANTDHWPEAARTANLVVQATPVGMKTGDVALLDANAFRAGQRLFDLIYWFPETVHMAAARTAGATVANGLGMLLHQGAKAFEIWTGQSAPLDAMRAALQAELRTRQTGMPT